MTRTGTITEHAGEPYPGRREGEEQRDRFYAEQDTGASIYFYPEPGADEPMRVAEPVYRIMGSGESRGGGYRTNDDAWRWGTGTNLRVARSSIPALMKVLADLMEHDADAELQREYDEAHNGS